MCTSALGFSPLKTVVKMTSTTDKHQVTTAVQRMEGVVRVQKVNALLAEDRRLILTAQLAPAIEAELSRVQEEYVQSQLKRRKKDASDVEAQTCVQLRREQQAAENAHLARLTETHSLQWYASTLQQQELHELREQAQELRRSVVTKNQELKARVLRLVETRQKTTVMTSLGEWAKLMDEACDTEAEAREWEMRIVRLVNDGWQGYLERDVLSAQSMHSLASGCLRQLQGLHDQRRKHNKQADNLLRRGEHRAAHSTEDPSEMVFCRYCCIYSTLR